MQQNILERNPEADLRVYTVWLPVLPGDAREAWDEGVLPGARARHFWDAQGRVASWFARRTPGASLESVFYDVWLLYGRDARWDGDGVSDARGSGATVIGTTGELQRAIGPLLESGS